MAEKLNYYCYVCKKEKAWADLKFDGSGTRCALYCSCGAVRFVARSSESSKDFTLRIIKQLRDLMHPYTPTTPPSATTEVTGFTLYQKKALPDAPTVTDLAGPGCEGRECKNPIMLALWGLLDDIDTATDVYKNDDAGFRRFMLRKLAERHNVLYSDGYKLWFIGAYDSHRAAEHIVGIRSQDVPDVDVVVETEPVEPVVRRTTSDIKQEGKKMLRVRCHDKKCGYTTEIPDNGTMDTRGRLGVCPKCGTSLVMREPNTEDRYPREFFCTSCGCYHMGTPFRGWQQGRVREL